MAEESSNPQRNSGDDALVEKRGGWQKPTEQPINAANQTQGIPDKPQSQSQGGGQTSGNSQSDS